jgi:hypothetical protein
MFSTNKGDNMIDYPATVLDDKDAFTDILNDALLTGCSVDYLREVLRRERQRLEGIIRISALPRFLECPSSALPVQHPYDPPSEMATLGTAAHAALATIVANDMPDVDTLAKQHGVDPDELAYLISYGTRAWEQIGLDHQHCRCEQTLHGRGIEGTADVAYHDGVNAVIVDWKTGRVRRSYRAQLAGYAAALTHEFVPPESGVVRVVTVWLRFGEFETATITPADIEGLYDDIQTAKLRIGKSYAPGDACGYCPRQLVCDARHEYLASASVAIRAVQHVDPDPVILAQLYEQYKLLGKAREHYKTALTLALRNGPLPDGNGNMLELATMTRDRVDPQLAWPVLVNAGVPDDDIAQCVSMSKTSLLRVVGKDLKRGLKGKARGQFWEAMKAAGAVKQNVSETIAVRKEVD